MYRIIGFDYGIIIATIHILFHIYISYLFSHYRQQGLHMLHKVWRMGECLAIHPFLDSLQLILFLTPLHSIYGNQPYSVFEGFCCCFLSIILRN